MLKQFVFKKNKPLNIPQMCSSDQFLSDEDVGPAQTFNVNVFKLKITNISQCSRNILETNR